MAANELSFNQISTLLNAIHSQATGHATLAALNTQDFVTQAQAVLKTGYDPVCNAISQVLSKTIFSQRPYTAKFRGLMVDAVRWGNHVRKINIADKPWRDDDRAPLTDGSSVDQQMVSKPNILQTNMYGENVFEKPYTLFKDQLDVAFTSPEELAQFVSLVTTNANDLLEQSREELARSLICNYAAAKTVTTTAGIEGSEGVVHLLTEYNAKLGLTGDDAYTVEDIYKPANFSAFIKWAYARVAEVSAMLTERSTMYQVNCTIDGVSKAISRHVPYQRQRVYVYNPAKFEIEARVLADAFHDNYLKLADNEGVNFWQSIKSPDRIICTPNWLGSDGTITNGAGVIEPVSLSNVFGVIVDEETLGWSPFNSWQAPAPFNSRGGYTTVWMHETQRHWTDMTEKGVVFILD